MEQQSENSLTEEEHKLIRLTSDFCEQYLDDDHNELTRKMVVNLSKKRDVQFQGQDLKKWAAAVIHALGSINYLFDSSFEPYISEGVLSDYFNVPHPKLHETSNKIKKLLKLDLFDNIAATLRNHNEDPMRSLLLIDGFFVNLEVYPPELREKVREARKQWLNVSFSWEEE